MPIRQKERFDEGFLGRNEEESLAILEEYKPSISFLANRLAKFTGLDAEDLVSEGIIGLARAVRDFDEERSVMFRTFALYKIKDAMREFVNTQTASIKIPQYLHDASRLGHKLRRLLSSKIPNEKYLSFSTIWELSLKMELEEGLKKSVEELKDALQNLADRSHTSVVELVDRAEVLPSLSLSAIDTTVTETELQMTSAIIDLQESQEAFTNSIFHKEIMDELNDVLTGEEMEILMARYVEGLTIRELAPKYGIKPESLVVRTNNILKKAYRRLKRKKLY